MNADRRERVLCRCCREDVITAEEAAAGHLCPECTEAFALAAPILAHPFPLYITGSDDDLTEDEVARIRAAEAASVAAVR